MSAKRILLLASTSRDLGAFVTAIEKLSLTPVIGVPAGLRLPPLLRDNALELDFATRDSVLKIVTDTQPNPVAAIIPIDEVPTAIAARAASMLGLTCHPPKAADKCLDSEELRRALTAADVPVTESRQSHAVPVLVSDRRLRVFPVRFNPDQQLPSSPVLTVQETIARGARALGLQHGPAHFEVAPEGNQWAIRSVSLAAAHSPETDLLRFKIPLVDEDVSWPEAVIRNALGLDITRLHLQ